MGLFGGDATLVDEGLDEGVVARDLRQLVVAQQVGAGVPDVDQADLASAEQDRGEGGAHAVELRVLLDLLGDGGVALAGRPLELAQQIVARLVVVEMRERRDHQLRGDLARGVPAHAVGQGEKTRAGVHRVLVVRPYEAPVAACGVAENESHGRNSITVLPTRTGVPSGTRTAVVTFTRSRYVPLVDPRSSTYQSLPRGDRRAWRVDA